MTNTPSRETIKRLKKEYPAETKVILDYMDDAQAPPVGTKGTVRLVDDIGSIHVSWENGSSLAVAYGEDRCHKVTE